MQILCGAGFDETAIDFSALVSALTHKNAVVRRNAREQLVAVGRPIVDAVRQLLHDKRPHVRWEAVKTLASIADPRTAGALVQVLEEEDEFDIRWVAGEGLAAMGREGLRPLLATLAARPGSATLQEGARHVCHHLSHRRAFRLIVPLLIALRSAEPTLAMPILARRALAELGR
ncbi:MAG: HEAT repeat domain-containing protein [Thermoguttaceae bacterium]